VENGGRASLFVVAFQRKMAAKGIKRSRWKQVANRKFIFRRDTAKVKLNFLQLAASLQRPPASKDYCIHQF
jgi:hypothetical protein